MSNRGKLYIVPDENQIAISEYQKDITMNHLEGFIDFNEKFQLGYHFENGDFQKAPCQLAADGHLIIKTETDSQLAIAYIPKKVTDRQDYWIHSHQEELSNYGYIGAFVIKEDGNFEELDAINGLDKIIRLCDKRNIFYEKKEDDKNVRKKI